MLERILKISAFVLFFGAIIASIFMYRYVNYDLNGFMKWRGIDPADIKLHMERQHNRNLYLYETERKGNLYLGIIITVENGRIFKHDHREINVHKSKVKNTIVSNYYSLFKEGGKLGGGLVLGGYKEVETDQTIGLQPRGLDEKLIIPELTVREEETNKLYFMHDFGEVESLGFSNETIKVLDSKGNVIEE